MFLICPLIGIYFWILVARAIISLIPLFKPGWVAPSGFEPVVVFLNTVTDPPINALRKVIPQPYNFPFDLAFTVLFLILVVLRSTLCPGGGIL